MEYENCSRLCSFRNSTMLDFPLTVAEKSYNNTMNTLGKYTKKVAEASTQSATLEGTTLSNPSAIIISGDRTLKTRGYSRVAVCAIIGAELER
ncbi:hypothetical protein NPIL_339241 [Nephila pilipes]|uniref:Uncharacterized protein n=1 Tax=Nephila pilipes TaxID=299642 RepID=A0A8X6MU40_NEPPI|nr:hypothetical protein NPIL_339241 [Nephila pilipes]